MGEKVLPEFLVAAIQAGVVPKAVANSRWHGSLHQESALLVETKCISFTAFLRQCDHAPNRNTIYLMVRYRLEGEFPPPRRANLQETGEPLDFVRQRRPTVQQPVPGRPANFNAPRGPDLRLPPPLRVRYPGLGVSAF